MVKISFSAHPMLLGFEQIDRLVEKAIKAGSDSYPPYNIEKENEERYKISLAVAGFVNKDLSVSVEENQLIIIGHQKDLALEKVFVHRGISNRQFQKTFIMADGVEVESAELVSGLLNIYLIRKRLQQLKRNIEILEK